MMVRTLTRVWSPQLRNRRRVDVHLPPSYGDGRGRYPVVYMQDGQNLADPETSFAGTWALDRALDDLAGRRAEVIVVGIHHAGERRIAEYSPFPDGRHGGGDGDAYLSFVADSVKPRIDRLFRTRRGRASTMILGSSMGGLISLYAVVARGDVFGGAGVLSPALWYGQGRIFDVIRAVPAPTGRVYLDVGTREGPGMVRDARRMARLLARQGLRASDGSLRFVEDEGGRHSEADWARRLPGALEFLLA
jgi:predicted alpha/beta superfamily hydrolase